MRLLTPNPQLLIGEGEFYVTVRANIDANCIYRRKITLYRNGTVAGRGSTKNYGNVTIIVGPPPPAGRYIAKMPKKVLRGKNHSVICGAAESRVVVVR